ncbi:MAG: hypothetical protein MUC34_18000 [Anaerolineae bacterium]|nr:hypothetical protein [Anaerolineae bacterium]
MAGMLLDTMRWLEGALSVSAPPAMMTPKNNRLVSRRINPGRWPVYQPRQAQDDAEQEKDRRGKIEQGRRRAVEVGAVEKMVERKEDPAKLLGQHQRLAPAEHLRLAFKPPRLQDADLVHARVKVVGVLDRVKRHWPD